MTDLAVVEPAEAEMAGSGGQVQVFSFGEPESVIDRRGIFDLLELWSNGRWYEMPVPPRALARAYRMAPHHQSAIVLKRNLLLKAFKPTRWLDRATFGRAVLDWLIMGNLYWHRLDNLAGRPMTLDVSPAINTRVGLKPGEYWWAPGLLSQAETFPTGKIHHVLEPDVAQEIYGLPEYLSALQSGLLNEAATLFRRRYFLNGSHAGFILYISEEGFSEEDYSTLAEQLKSAKGPGNFRNLLLHIPKGKKDGVQLLPIAEVAAKDDWLGIKNTTRDDMLAAHRTPPQLLGIVPTNNGGFGDIGRAADVFHAHEIMPIMTRMLEVNDWLGVEAVAFEDYQPVGNTGSAAGAN